MGKGSLAAERPNGGSSAVSQRDDTRRKRHRQRARDARGPDAYLPHLSDGFRERDAKTIFLRRLPTALQSKEDIIEALQSAFGGDVVHVHVRPDYKYGFAHFEEEDTACAAVEAQSVIICGEEVEVKKATLQPGASGPVATKELEEGAGVAEDGNGSEHYDSPSPTSHPPGATGPVPHHVPRTPAATPEDGQPLGQPSSRSARTTSSPVCPEDETKGRKKQTATTQPGPGDEDWEEPDPFGEVWAESTKAVAEHFPGDEELEDTIQMLQAACVHALEMHGERQALHELGQDPLVKEHKLRLGALTMLEFIHGLPENFDSEDKGNGVHMVELVSAGDPEGHRLEALLAKARAKSRRRQVADQLSGSKQGPTRKAAMTGPGVFSDGWKARDSRAVYIGALPRGVRSKEDIAAAMQKTFGGEVTHVHVEDRKFGFVHFAEESYAAAALDAGWVDVCGGKLEIRVATKGRKRGRKDGGREDDGRQVFGEAAPRTPEWQHKKANRNDDGLDDGPSAWRPPRSRDDCRGDEGDNAWHSYPARRGAERSATRYDEGAGRGDEGDNAWHSYPARRGAERSATRYDEGAGTRRGHGRGQVLRSRSPPARSPPPAPTRGDYDCGGRGGYGWPAPRPGPTTGSNRLQTGARPTAAQAPAKPSRAPHLDAARPNQVASGKNSAR